ncbi:MAG: UvrD-helicase domain-containing protein, partial [Methanomassiliicoccaceae archaeon]|nr:UvrD-helicase domain-containing protein [Methanomassiliicoccaceae archaeon]
ADILMLTFTNNAAAEMEERVKGEIASSGKSGDVRSSTFDSFCMRVVMESPESAGRFFRTKETLTRNAGLVQNESLNLEYFRNVYTRFIRRYGRMYGNIPAIVGTATEDVYDVIQRLMSIGIAPTHEGEWFGRDTGVLLGDADKLKEKLRRTELSDGYKKAGNRIHPERGAENVTEKMIDEAVDDKRETLLSFLNGVYYEFIRSSIADNRLTFSLNALFAFIILYSNRQVRNMMSFRYVMIDEFQDTNELQFMISLLILKEPNLCAVGDWKQGIYGFRYASIENITNFSERLNEMRRFLNKGEKRVTKLPDPAELQLTENYRSTQRIIDASFGALRCRAKEDDDSLDTEWLKDNVTELRAVRDDDLTEVEKIHAGDHEKEILAIIEKINGYVTDPKYVITEYDKRTGAVTERRPGYGDIAVLCRNGAMCTDVKNAADAYNIPAHLQGDVNIMATREGKLALAWLRYINNKKDVRGPVAILTDIGYTLSEMKEMFPKRYGTDNVPDELKEIRNTLIRKKRRINDLLTSVFRYHGLNNDITQSVISVISSAHSGSMLTVSDVIGLIESDIGRSSAYPVDALLDGRSVMIQTMHKSKGLEYPIVIVGGLTAGKMPSTKNIHPLITFDPLYGVRIRKEYVVIGGHHELFDCWKWEIIKQITGPDRNGERRLFFVALSRAKQYITITSSGKTPSFFFKDIHGIVKETDPDPEKMSSGRSESVCERPPIPVYKQRRKRVSLHDIMGEYEESGGGKGAEHGIRVHKEAQRIMSGMGSAEDSDETRYIKKIFDSLKGAKIMTEIDCSLPVEDITVAGRIDMLAVFDDRTEVHDFKTDMNRINEPRYVIQLSVYAHAAASLGRPVICYIDYVSQGISVNVPILTAKEIYGLVK